MTEHTVKAYEGELTALATGVADMGAQTLDQVRAAVAAITAHDAALARSTVDADARLDLMEARIEQQAVRLIALRQPMARDLRDILGSMKIAANLERCGDLAKNIAKRALAVDGADFPDPSSGSIARMGRLVADRLGQVLAAQRTRDVSLALAVWRQDAEVDQQYESLFRELLTYMMADPRMISPCAHLLFVAKNLERIGDHATNIAEAIHYQITGDPAPGAGRPKWDLLVQGEGEASQTGAP